MALPDLGEGLGHLRLCSAEVQEAMERSLASHGQITPLVVCERPRGWEVIDGFKRLRAARALRWEALWVHAVEVRGAQAKVQIVHSNRRESLTEIEEAWIIRALHREDGLVRHRLRDLGRARPGPVSGRLPCRSAPGPLGGRGCPWPAASMSHRDAECHASFFERPRGPRFRRSNMSNVLAMREKLYEYEVRFTGVTAYGVALEDILAGKVPPPPQGARFDVAFEGTATGRLAGTVKGVDYLYVRADGRLELDIRAEITTPDGCKIALSASGVGVPSPGSPIAQLRENVKLSTCYEDYGWVNTIQIWAPGTVNLAEGVVNIEGFAA